MITRAERVRSANDGSTQSAQLLSGSPERTIVTTAVDPGSAPRSVRITMSDFMTGLLTGLAKKNVHVVTIDGPKFYAAVVDVFHELELRAEADPSLNLRFWLTQDEIHQDSPDIRDGITGAVQRRLVSLDNPTYQHMRMKVTAEEADDYLDHLPGGKELYLDLATKFKDTYPAVA